MAHFAELDENNVVKQVLVVHNNELLEDGVEKESKGVVFLQSLFGHNRWKQTSYNGNMRKNYAGVGFFYDATKDAFIPPKPFASWTLDENLCKWTPPVPYPNDGNFYYWDEPSLSWTAVN